MRHLDFAPLYRSTIGFDRLFNLLDQSPAPDTISSYPPYNIERTGENDYRITVAVAGFSENELSLESKENTLTIRGSHEQTDAAARKDVLYQGISERTFERRFQLADHVRVEGASLVNGLLHVELVRELPEAQKPRQIPIGKSGLKAVESQKAA